ncbi:MAG: protein-tyrosine kinase [Lachnospiraceae bacterium]|nr:protein-tyrosine kinase [Lachnospiraceae bacterium]
METASRREENEIEIDLFEVIQVLFAHFWLILSAGIFAGLVCLIISKFILAPYYDSTTKIYILNKQSENTVTYSDVQMGTQLTKDYAELINSRYVLEEVIQKLIPDIKYKEMKSKVTVSTPTDTRIVSITVRDSDPVQAMNLANCIREVASEHIQNVMDIEAVNLVESANMPTEKAGPSVSKWTMIGALAGVLLVCAVLLIGYLIDDTIKSTEDIEKYLGLSTLALIPMEEKLNNNTKKKHRRSSVKRVR